MLRLGLLTFGLMSVLWAQDPRGSIIGRVVDVTGDPDCRGNHQDYEHGNGSGCQLSQQRGW
jgi:hypothetical protein